MKFLHCLIVLQILTINCVPAKTYKAVKYKFGDNYRIIVSGRIPANYTDYKKIEVQSNNYDVEYHYIYADSAIFYISNAHTFGFPNYDNISELKSEESVLRLRDDSKIRETNKILLEGGHLTLHVAPYIMEFEGKDNQGRYWKDVKYGEISVGYIGVNESQKDLFDKYLDSFEITLK